MNPSKIPKLTFPIPRLSVSAIIKFPLNQILLTKRKGPLFKDFWCLAGGGVKKGESVEDAIIREVKEETGLDVTIQKKMQSYFEKGIQDSIIYSYINTPFIVVPKSLNLMNLKGQIEEVTEIELFPISKLPILAFRQTEIVENYLFQIAKEAVCSNQ